METASLTNVVALLVLLSPTPSLWPPKSCCRRNPSLGPAEGLTAYGDRLIAQWPQFGRSRPGHAEGVQSQCRYSDNAGSCNHFRAPSLCNLIQGEERSRAVLGARQPERLPQAFPIAN
jgi:hypothetical protein